MNGRFKIILIVCAALFAGVYAQASETLSQGWDAAIAGRYDEAAAFGAELETADGYTLAASSLIGKILTLRSDDKKDDAKQARDFAEEALKLDPENPEALLQYAVAYGIVTRETGNFTVWRKKMPQKSLAAIEAAMIANPNDARVLALLGSWHLGVIRKAGADRGADMFGANEAAGIAAFEKAAVLAPSDIVVSTNFALSALALDPVLYGPRGQSLLTTASIQTPTSDIEHIYKSWAIELLDLMDDKAALQAMATYYVDGE